MADLVVAGDTNSPLTFLNALEDDYDLLFAEFTPYTFGNACNLNRS